jgi:putative ABC transport system permease protein
MLSAADIAGMQQTPAFERVAPFGNYSGLTYVGDQTSEEWSGVQVGPEFFQVLGVRPLLGRVIDGRDTGPDAAPAIVLSHRVWQRTFGGDSSVVGRDIQVSARTRTVVGVLAPTFVSPDRDPEVWTPLDLSRILRDPVAARQSRIYRAVGRIASDATPARLQSSLDAVYQSVRAADYGIRDAAPAKAIPLRDDMLGHVRTILLVVMGAAVLVLLLCCVNVAGLFLTRATARRRELAIRLAVGAGRARVVRQLLTESVVIALVGGTLGVTLAFLSKRTLGDVVALLLPSVRDVPIDGGVLGFAVAVSLFCPLAFGLVPALMSTRLDLRGALGESSRGAAGGRTTMRMSRALVVAQMALAVVLLIGAGLLGRTLVKLERTGVGFDTGSDVLTFRVNLASARYADPARQTGFFVQYMERIRSLPRVRAVGGVGVSPWSGYTSFGPDSLSVEGFSDVARSSEMASLVTVSDGYFEALGIPVRSGRAFAPTDGEGAVRVAVVNESLARHYWSTSNPLGRRIRIGGVDAAWLEVVGVAGDVRARPWQDVPPTVYVPMWQNPVGGAELVVRTTGNGLALVPAVRRELRQLDPTLPVSMARTLDDVFGAMLAGQRLPLIFTGAFAVLALLLAVLGGYSVMSYSVTSRRREFGIRTALGARRSSVLGLVLRQGMTMALLGSIVGLVAAGAASPLLSRLLIGVTPHDLVTFAAVPLILILVSCAACLVPARRSIAIEPVEALRVD